MQVICITRINEHIQSQARGQANECIRSNQTANDPQCIKYYCILTPELLLANTAVTQPSSRE